VTGATGPWSRRDSVPREDVELAVFECGDPDGSTVVLVHGWPDTHRVWDGLAELLALEHRVIAYDTRGQGDSVTGAPDRSFSVDVLAADLMSVIASASPGSPVHVVGHDWGSIQAWEAVCRPGAKSRIASFTTMSGPHLDHVAWWARRTLARPSARGLVGLLGQAVASSYVPFLVSPLAPPVLRTLGTPDMVSGLRYYRANFLRPRGRAAQRTSVPVLQLALTRDPAVRPWSLAASDRWTDTWERRPLPHGHWAVATHPEVVAEHVLGWIAQHQPARTQVRGDMASNDADTQA
jgi:pimeloyl-ACP methyl ester carboxylesterase